MDEQVAATRMEQINLKERISLAEKGHELIKQKRDILIIEMMTILHTSTTMRKRLNDHMRKAYESLGAAQAYHSIFEMENIALSVRKAQNVRVNVRNTMGVRLPTMKRVPTARRLTERGYSILYSSSRVDEAAENFEKALEMTLELAEREASMKRLLKEIEKSKRRVNALEYIILPKLEESKTEIMLQLDEMERDNFITLKYVKGMMEKAQEA